MSATVGNERIRSESLGVAYSHESNWPRKQVHGACPDRSRRGRVVRPMKPPPIRALGTCTRLHTWTPQPASPQTRNNGKGRVHPRDGHSGDGCARFARGRPIARGDCGRAAGLGSGGHPCLPRVCAPSYGSSRAGRLGGRPPFAKNRPLAVITIRGRLTRARSPTPAEVCMHPPSPHSVRPSHPP